MASPTTQTTNEENASPVKTTPKPIMNASQRRVLGDVSPNLKIGSNSPAFLRKPPAGSPLKRSFTAAMEGGEGFTYLKRRKLSDDEFSNQVPQSGQEETEEIRLQVIPPAFRPVSQSGEEDSSTIPIIAEPSPTEPNTPSEADDSTQNSSEERKSFSSLINYDPSSQTSNLLFKTFSNAEMLKLRLRVAMYKVRTNQIDIPFADLQTESPIHTVEVDEKTAVEEAVAELRREAQEVMNRRPHPPPIPKLLPAPVLLPTAYSSRMIYETELPSSPPVSLSLGGLPAVSKVAGVATPRRAVRRLSSPPSSQRRFAMPSEQELTSSVVKGRVAEGLLGLRNAA